MPGRGAGRSWRGVLIILLGFAGVGLAIAAALVGLAGRSAGLLMLLSALGRVGWLLPLFAGRLGREELCSGRVGLGWFSVLLGRSLLTESVGACGLVTELSVEAEGRCAGLLTRPELGCVGLLLILSLGLDGCGVGRFTADEGRCGCCVGLLPTLSVGLAGCCVGRFTVDEGRCGCCTGLLTTLSFGLAGCCVGRFTVDEGRCAGLLLTLPEGFCGCGDGLFIFAGGRCGWGAGLLAVAGGRCACCAGREFVGREEDCREAEPCRASLGSLSLRGAHSLHWERCWA